MKRTLVTCMALASIAALPAARAAVPVPIANAGFEDPAVTDNAYNDSITDWTQFNGGDIGVWNVGTGDLTTEAPEGFNIAYVYQATAEAGLSQVLSSTLQADASYTLTVQVCNTLSEAGFPGYRVQLLADGAVLAEDDNTLAPAEGEFLLSTVNYTYSAAEAALVGQPLEIRLLSKALITTSEVEFDDVQLTATLANPAANAGGPYTVPSPGGSLSLDGSGSVPSDGQTITTYEWDLNNDGTFGDVTGAMPTAISDAELIANWSMALGTNTIQLKVTDSSAKTSTTTGTVSLTAFPTPVAYWPMRDGLPGTTVTGADDLIDDPAHPATDATINNADATWEADPLRGIVFNTVEGNRLTAGKQGIDLNVDPGWTWSIWAMVASSNITDPGADCLMGTRNGAWNKMDRTSTSNWINPKYPDFADDTWHHWVFVGDTTGGSVYRDGVLQDKDTSFNHTGGALATDIASLPLEIGGTSRYTEDITGLISDVAIWNLALTEAQIQDLANGANILADFTAPFLAATTPADDDPETPGSLLQAIFDEPVVLGSGDIRIINTSDAVTTTIAVTDAQVTVSGAALTIKPTVPLIGGKDYAIEMDAGVVKNVADLDFAGIGDQTTWNFTVDNIPPTLASMVDSFGGGPIYENLTSLTYTVTFNEPIDGSTIDATDFDNAGTATISIGTVTQTAPESFTVVVNPSSTGTLQLRIPSGSVVNDEGNNTLVVPVLDDTTIDINAGPSPAITITGTDGGNDSWNTASNWDGGFVPIGPYPAIIATGVTATVNNEATPAYSGGLTFLAGSELDVRNVTGSENAIGTGTVTFNAGSTLRLRAGYSFTIPGDIVFTGDAEIFNSDNSTDNDQRTLTGDISGTGLFTYSMRRGNILHLDGTNTWSGGFVANFVDNNFNNASRVQPGNSGLGTGDVTLNDGISLEILGGLSDTIDDGAVLNLNGRGRDNQKLKLGSDETVDELWVDGNQKAAGDYTATTSAGGGPALQDMLGNPLIAGSGTLTVVSGPAAGTPYDTWTTRPFMGTLNNPDPGFDFDKGGLATGIEWVVGGDPTDQTDDAGLAPTGVIDATGTYLVFSYQRTDEANDDGLTLITAQYGSDLQGWTEAQDTVNGVIISVTNDSPADTVVVKIPIALAVGGELYARLNVVITP